MSPRALNFCTLAHAIGDSLALALRRAHLESHIHGEEAQVYARGLADHMCLGAYEREIAAVCARLHDAPGKLIVAHQLMQASGLVLEQNDPLMVEIRQHTEHGAEYFQAWARSIPACAPEFDLLATVCRDHHRRYEEGGENINFWARFTAAVDVWHAITGPRGYRQPASVKDGLREMERASGTQLDPEITGHLVEMIRKGFAIE